MDDDDPRIEQTLTQILVCRNARFGCPTAFPYQLGEYESAKQARQLHESELCEYRSSAPA
jgi:hypothetical protein